jgi:putative tricarboxylic transport membrane protein
MSDDPDAQARRRAVARVLALGGMAAVAGATAVPSRLLAARSAWPSTGNIELVVPSGPASGLDTAMRTVKRISDAKRLFNVPTIVVNRPGAGGTLAYQYLNQRPGDGRLLALASPSLVTNRLMGTGELDHRDVTPVCTLFSENIVFMVRMDSNLLDGRALVGALRKRPDAISFGVATALGGANHIAAASVLKAVGLDARAGLYVPYKSGGDALVALLGGEVGVVPVAAPVAVPQAQAGKVRVLATASGQRLGGDLAGVPTHTSAEKYPSVLRLPSSSSPAGLSRRLCAACRRPRSPLGSACRNRSGVTVVLSSRTGALINVTPILELRLLGVPVQL